MSRLCTSGLRRKRTAAEPNPLNNSKLRRSPTTASCTRERVEPRRSLNHDIRAERNDQRRDDNCHGAQTSVEVWASRGYKAGLRDEQDVPRRQQDAVRAQVAGERRRRKHAAKEEGWRKADKKSDKQHARHCGKEPPQSVPPHVLAAVDPRPVSSLSSVTGVIEPPCSAATLEGYLHLLPTTLESIDSTAGGVTGTIAP